MLKDFKAFALKGNVLDLAVAVVIGAAFGKIVSSLVENIIMPLIGILLNGVDFTQLKFTFGNAEVLYGNFIQAIFDFIIIAFAIFMFIRLLSKLSRKKEEAVENIEEKVNTQEVLLTEIRDLLKQQSK